MVTHTPVLQAYPVEHCVVVVQFLKHTAPLQRYAPQLEGAPPLAHVPVPLQKDAFVSAYVLSVALYAQDAALHSTDAAGALHLVGSTPLHTNPHAPP